MTIIKQRLLAMAIMACLTIVVLWLFGPAVALFFGTFSLCKGIYDIVLAIKANQNK